MKQKEKKKQYEYWLHSLPGVGNRTIARLLAVFGEAEAIYQAFPGKLEEVLGKKRAERIREACKDWDLEGRYAAMRQKGIELVTLGDREYPDRLRTIGSPPYALYYKGKLPGKEVPAAAVIGARECSEYGRFVAEAFAGKLAQAGVEVISGMARGIDGIAQQAAVRSGGKTFAVLGSGVDVCYPASNRRLYEEILACGGGILSVFPPGTEPQKNQFPERNRIVAGLSDLLLVVEARQKSGTWITVDMALEQGKNVYAVPGRLTDRLSDGCNLLIRQGAGIALAPEDLLAELSVLHNRKILGGDGKTEKVQEAAKEQETASPKEPGEPEDRVLNCLDFRPQQVDEIRRKLEERGDTMELPHLMTRLVELCMEGKAKQVSGNYFVRTGKSMTDIT